MTLQVFLCKTLMSPSLATPLIIVIEHYMLDNTSKFHPILCGLPLTKIKGTCMGVSKIGRLGGNRFQAGEPQHASLHKL